jgi:uncharacterized membrane protein HdeD (DUF308 family)
MATAAVARRITPHGAWWVVLLEGIFSLLIGLFLLTAPGATVIVLTRVIGWFWLISGVIAIVSIFTRDTGIYWGWLLINGVLGILAGLAVLDHPLLAAILAPTALVIFLGLEGLLIGLTYLVQAFRGGGWGVGVLGLLSIVFGTLILLVSTPPAALVTIVTWVGVTGIVGGIALIVMGLRQRPR